MSKFINSGDETDFLLSNTPLHEIVESYPGVKYLGPGKQFNPNGTRDGRYSLPNGDIVSVAPTSSPRNKKKKNYQMFSIEYTPGSGGAAVQFIQYMENCSKKEAFDKLREINKVTRTPKNKNSEKVISAQAIPDKVVPFEPSGNHAFFLDRGITAQTLEHPLFKSLFGSYVGNFGGAETDKDARWRRAELKYSEDLIIPYFNLHGEIINLEYKNSLQDNVFNDELERAVRNGTSINKVRKNPSAFIAQASKSCVWHSRIPSKPTHLLLVEQPADALAYFQMERANRPELENAIFVGIGGNLSQGQIPLIQELVRQHNISNVEFLFDNDLHGFRYSIKLYNTFTENQSHFNIEMDAAATYSISFKILNTQPLIDKETFQNRQQKIESTIAELFPNRNNYFIPYDTAGGIYGVVHLPYSPENASQTFSLISNLLPSEHVQFGLNISQDHKDWNDKLLDKNIIEPIESVPVYDFLDQRKKILLDNRGAIILQHKLLNSEQTIHETIGEFNMAPGSGKSRIEITPSFIGRESTSELIKAFEADLKALVPELSTHTINHVFNNMISYSLITKDFKRENGDVLAQLTPQGVVFTNGINNSPLEMNLILTKTALLQNGESHNWVNWKLIGNELYDGEYNNYRLRYNEYSNIILESRDVGIWENRAVWDDGINLNLSAQQKLNLQDMFNIYREMDKLDKSNRLEFNGLKKRYLELSRVTLFCIEHGVIRQLTPVANWDQVLNRFIAVPNKQLSHNQLSVLDRFSKYYRHGRILSKPGLIGTIDSNFNFKLAAGVEEERDFLPVEKMYLKVFRLYLQENKDNLVQFKELYPEPVVPVSSGKGVLSWVNQSCLTYDKEKRGFLMDSEFTNRTMNPTFWKQAELFLKSGGVYYGYDKNLRVNTVTLDIFYKRPNLIVGKLIKDKEDKLYYVLFSNVPDQMKTEIRALLEIPEAPKDLVYELGISLEGRGRVKEKKMDSIPLEYDHFFDKNKKFIILSNDDLKEKNLSFREHYMQAYLWYKENYAADNTPEIRNNVGLHYKENDIMYNRIKCGYYDPQLDRIVLNMTIDSKFYQELAFLERQKVKTIPNRQFSQYFVAPSTEKVMYNNNAVLRLLEEIDIDGEGMMKFRTPEFKVRNFGRKDGPTLFIESSFKEFSPDFTAAIALYAKTENLNIDYVDSIPVAEKAFSIDINVNQEVDLTFKHELLLSKEGILTTLVNSRDFEGVLLQHEDGSLSVKYAFTKSGQVEVPLLTSGEQEGVWLSRFPEPLFAQRGDQHGAIPTLVVCQTPEYGLLHFQNDILRTINQRNYYVSITGKEDSFQHDFIEKLRQQTKIDTIQFVGEKEWSDKFYDLYTDPGRDIDYKVIPSPPDLKEMDTLLSIKKEISTVPPYPLLQNAVDELKHPNHYNVAQGVVLIPISNSYGRDKVIIGKSIKSGKIKGKDGKEAGAVFASVVSNPQRITISPNIPEAIFYMAMNRNFADSEMVLACADGFTPEVASQIKKYISLPRFGDEVQGTNVSVINSPKYRFYTTLAEGGMRMLSNALTPAPTHTFSSYHEEYAFIQKNKDAFESQHILKEVGVGKLNASVDSEQQQKHAYEVIETVPLKDKLNEEIDA